MARCCWLQDLTKAKWLLGKHCSAVMFLRWQKARKALLAWRMVPVPAAQMADGSGSALCMAYGLLLLAKAVLCCRVCNKKRRVSNVPWVWVDCITTMLSCSAHKAKGTNRPVCQPMRCKRLSKRLGSVGVALRQ